MSQFERSESYAITMAGLVLSRYDHILTLLVEGDWRLTLAERSGFTNGNYPADIIPTLVEASSSLKGLITGYLITDDKGRVLSYQDAWNRITMAPRPESEEGRQLVSDMSLVSMRHELEALWLQFESMEGVMIGRKWMDLKKSIEMGKPMTWRQ